MATIKKIDSCFIRLGLLIVLFIIYFQMSNQQTNVSALFTMSFVWIFSWFFIRLTKKKQNYTILYVIACSVLSIIHVFLFSPSGVSFDYYNKLIMFLCFLMFTYLCITVKIEKKLVQFIFVINIILSIFYVLFYMFGTQFDTRWLFLTLNFSNPNMTGIFLSYTFMYIFVLSVSYKELGYKKWLLLLTVPLFIILFYLIILTACRSAILTVLCFVFVIFVDMLFRGKIYSKKWIIGLWSIFPLVFALVYIMQQGNIVGDSFLTDPDVGKSSDSRMGIWGVAFSFVKRNLLFGDYCGISNGSGKSQLHNTHLDVIASYGLFPLILFVQFLYNAVKISQRKTLRFNKYSQWAFMICFVSGVFEAILVSGGLCIYILACSFLLMANSEIKVNVLNESNSN